MPNPFALSAALEAMLDEAGGAFETNLTAVLRALRLRINQLIRQMDRERGRVTQTATNLAIAQQAEGQIRAALIAGGYEGMVADAFAYLPQLTRFSGLSPEALLFTEFDVMSLEAFRGVKLGELGEFTDRIVNQLQQVLMKGVFGAQDERELFKELEAILLDTPAQAKTIYETALSEFVQTTIALKSDNTPDEEFVYTGPIDMRIRPFCLERVGQVFAREQIDAMDNGQLDNTFLTRGGYNCRHMWHRMETLGMFPRVAPGDYAAPRYQQQVEDVRQALSNRTVKARAIPRQLFHGTTYSGELEAMIPGNRADESGLVFTTPSRTYATEYGKRILTVELDIHRPFDVRTDLRAKALWDQYVDEQGAYTGSGHGVPEGYANDGLPFWENNEALARLAKTHGYDAIVSSEGNGKIGIGAAPHRYSIVKKR